MVTRCLCKTSRQYPGYGGRGIQVCKRWLKFENFYADMGPCPPGLTIERKNNNGHYRPSNCVWATRHAQDRNKRSNVWITYKGKTRCVADWNSHFGLKYNTLAKRLKYRSIEEVFSELC